MSAISLALEPTFIAPVQIPVPGGKSIPVQFTFKYRTKDELAAYMEEINSGAVDLSEVDLIMGIAEGWELADPFNAENVKRLLQKYHAANAVIPETYVREMIQAKSKN